MTQKELLYLEDAIGHESNIIMICQSNLEMISEPEIVSFMQNELKKHISMKEKLLNFLEDKKNE